MACNTVDYLFYSFAVKLMCRAQFEHQAFGAECVVDRASIPVKLLLQEAARACHKNVSEFLLDAGVIAANQALADRRHFVLGEEQWTAFQHALDRPVSSKPRLKKLLNEPGVLG